MGICGLLAILFGIFIRVVEGERWVDHTHGVRLTIERTMYSLASAESTQRRFLISHDRGTLIPYAEAKAATLGTLALIPELVDSPDQDLRAEQLTTLIRQRIEHLDRNIALVSAGQLQEVAAIIREGRGLEIMLQVRRLAAEMQEREAGLLAERAARVEDLRAIFLGSGVVVGVALFLVLGVAFHRTRRAAEQDRQIRRELATALQERTSLLREINHRVGNSLMMVSALIDLQSQSAATPETREALRRAHMRVGAVGQVHRRLQKAETITDLDFGDYVRALCDELDQSLTDGAERIEVKGLPLRLPVEKVVPLGLIVIELVTNAVRHGYGVGSNGTVDVCVDQRGEELHIAVKDWGKGWPAAERTRDGVGMTIVRALTGQLQGRMDVESNGTTTVSVTVPLAA